jgi:squalene-hopene/tetraprenyl-beta-curcumene cyclase
MTLTDDAGSRPLDFPTYTASETALTLSLGRPTPSHCQAREAWVGALRRRQLSADLGWRPADPAFGGWGYAIDPPRHPRPLVHGAMIADANISATLFAIAARRFAGATTQDQAIRDALRFVKRCQNFTGDAERSDPRYDDGGFHFSPTDAVRNKAGRAGHDMSGHDRYHAYGSATADGLRVLALCGLGHDHPRVVAARRWLERRFRPDTNPGVFADGRQVLRHAYYFYYCWSVSHALMALGRRDIETDSGPIDWPASLADELIRRQGPDGAWRSDRSDAKEDDPLVATPLATAALSICRMMMTRRLPPLCFE